MSISRNAFTIFIMIWWQILCKNLKRFKKLCLFLVSLASCILFNIHVIQWCWNTHLAVQNLQHDKTFSFSCRISLSLSLSLNSQLSLSFSNILNYFPISSLFYLLNCLSFSLNQWYIHFLFLSFNYLIHIFSSSIWLFPKSKTLFQFSLKVTPYS